MYPWPGWLIRVPLIRAAIRKRLLPASLGVRGERAAARFLRRNGLILVARNYRNHIGEIDLIGVERTSIGRETEKTVVFVEVKTRRSHSRGLAVEAVGYRKQQQIVDTALVFLRQHDLLECRFRFDIVAILWPPKRRKPTIRHYRDAFQPPGQGQLFT